MNKWIKNMGLLLITVIVWNYAAIQVIESSDTIFIMKEIMSNTVLLPQKILFNNAIGLYLYIYLNSDDINRIEYVTRCKYIQKIQFIKCGMHSAIYTAVIFMAVCFSAFYKLGNPDGLFLIIWPFIKLFVINVMFASTFHALAVFMKRTAALALNIIFVLMMLICRLLFCFYYGDADEWILTDSIFVPAAVICFWNVIEFECLKKKEYL